MRAAYKTRKEPSRSGRRSCGYKGWLAGHRSVPSGWGVKAEPGKPCVKEGRAKSGRAIVDRRRGRFRRSRLCLRGRFRLKGWSKFGAAQICWREVLAQFQPEIPDPLRENLAKLLPTRRMRVPPIRILLVVFIGKGSFKRAAMQVEVKHIRGRKRRRGKGADEQLVDHPAALEANGGSTSGRTSGDHQTDLRSGWGQGNGGAVVQGTRHPAFRMGAHLTRSTR